VASSEVDEGPFVDKYTTLDRPRVAAAKVEEIRTPWRTSTSKEQKYCKIVEELFLLGEVWKDLFPAPATSPG
jgi:hypothetical protein